MIELKVKIEAAEPQRQRAIYVLNLLASITGIRLRRVLDNPDLIYGTTSLPAANRIPISDIEFSGKWQRRRLLDLELNLPIEIENIFDSDDKKLLRYDLLGIIYRRLVSNLTESAGGYGKLRHCEYRPPEFCDYAHFFCRWLILTGKLPSNFDLGSPWPNKAPYALGLSHDIDILKRRIFGGAKLIANSLLGKKIPGGFLGSMVGLGDSLYSTITGRPNPYCRFFESICPASKATVFVFAGKRNDPKDPTYKLNQLAKILARFGLDELEIALHNGIGTSVDKEALTASRNKLSEILHREVKGIRPHYLDCQFPDFWLNLNGFSYSSSIGSDRAPGFVSGIEFPFYGFDFFSGKTIDIIELPLGLMDCALLGQTSPETAKAIENKILADCQASHCLLVLDWHNTAFYDHDYPGWGDSFWRLLDCSRKAGAFVASLGEIDDYWRNRCASLFLS